jgi:hypothetical protein
MPIVIQAREENGYVTYQPQGVSEYVSALTRSGLMPPQVPLQLRVPASELATSDAEAVEHEIAAFFGLGDVSGVPYQVHHA